MPDVDTSIYRPQPQQDPLAQISRIGGAANALGDLAVGQGMQQALDPATGQVDQNKLLGLLRQSPVGAMKAIPTMDALQKLRQAGFSADQAGVEAFQKRMAITHGLFSGLASKKAPTIADVHDIAAAALDPGLEGSKYGITLPVVMNAVKVLREAFKTGGPAALKAKALEIQSQAVTSAEALNQHNPNTQWVNRGGNWELVPTGSKAEPASGTVVPTNLPPTTPVASPGGTRYLGEQPAPPPAAVAPGARPAPQGAIPAAPGSTGRTRENGEPGAAPRSTFADRFQPPQARGPLQGLPTGEEKLLEASAERAARLQATAQTTAQYHADLNNLKTDSKILENLSGPTAEVEKKLNQFSQRLAKVGVTMTPTELKAAESFDKIVHQITLQQGQMFGGTDAARSISIDANPNLSMSNIGREGVIDMLQGNQDAVDTARQLWLKARASGITANQHDEFMNELVTPSDPKRGALDPRVFQFNRMSRDNQQKYLDQIDRSDLPEFERNYKHAIAQKWVKPPKAK